jgi:hypothetical protein
MDRNGTECLGAHASWRQGGETENDAEHREALIEA